MTVFHRSFLSSWQSGASIRPRPERVVLSFPQCHEKCAEHMTNMQYEIVHSGS